MPIPPLTHEGILPEGVHDCTLTEVGEAFGVSDPQRQRLWAAFPVFLDWARRLPGATFVWIDGSFVTDKVDPGDIDVILETLLDSAEALPFVLTVMAERAHQKQHHGVDALPSWPGIAPLTDLGLPVVEAFQRLRPGDAKARYLLPDAKKGILRVQL